jgi:hypothetical protein
MAKLTLLIDRLSKQQHNILTGSMLGDGFLRRDSKKSNSNFTINRALADIDYLKYQFNVFRNCVSGNESFKTRSYFDKRTNKTYYGCGFKTKRAVIFTEYHNKWYKLNEETNRYVKIIPNDLELNAEIIANWFCDDAYILNNNGAHHRFIIKFATDGFTKDECIFLAELLSKRYNEYFEIRHHEKDHWIVKSTSDTAGRALISDIDKVFPPGMKRKRLWDHPDARFYENQPEKTISTLIVTENIKQDLHKYLSTNFIFVSRDVATALNYFDIVDGKQMTSTTIQVYLTQFVKEGYLEKVIRNTPAKTYFYEVNEKGKQYFLSQSINAKPTLYCNR